MQEPRASPPPPTSCSGCSNGAAAATPYDLKGLVEAVASGNFWTLQHAQLYTEPARLAAAGYVTEEREEGGRRRKRYTITDKGREALREWRRAPTGELAELRDHGLLKLFFGPTPPRSRRSSSRRTAGSSPSTRSSARTTPATRRAGPGWRSRRASAPSAGGSSYWEWVLTRLRYAR